MLRGVLFFFFTLVEVFRVEAAPSSISPEELLNAPQDQMDAPKNIINTTTISPAPQPTTKNIASQAPNIFLKNYFYTYEQSMSPRAGFWLEKNKSIGYFLGIQYMLPNSGPNHWEIGADLFLPGPGQISFARRWIYFHRDRFRPFFKAGLSVRPDGIEGLATFLNKNNYLLRASAGFEDLLSHPLSIRIESEIFLGIEDIGILMSVGYSWGW